MRGEMEWRGNKDRERERERKSATPPKAPKHCKKICDV